MQMPPKHLNIVWKPHRIPGKGWFGSRHLSARTLTRLLLGRVGLAGRTPSAGRAIVMRFCVWTGTGLASCQGFRLPWFWVPSSMTVPRDPLRSVTVNTDTAAVAFIQSI